MSQMTEKQREEYREAAEQRLKERRDAAKEEKHRQELEQQLRLEQKAAESEEKDKSQARHQWIKAGGSVGTFEKQWPKLYEAIIFDRTLKAMASDAPPPGHVKRTLG